MVMERNMFNIPLLQTISRLASIFGQPNAQATTPPFVPIQKGRYQPPPLLPSIDQDQFDMGKRWQELYQPEMTMQNRYNSLISNYPEREQPSVLRRIGAAIYGMNSR